MYFEVKNGNNLIEPGVYSADNTNYYKHNVRPFIQHSHRVWLQGPRGGVRIVKDTNWMSPVGYITTNKEYMEEFFWLKLRAKEIS